MSNNPQFPPFPPFPHSAPFPQFPPFPHHMMPPHLPLPPGSMSLPPFPNQQPLSPQGQPQIGLISAAAPVEVGQPNCTLYIQNLPEKPNPLKHLPLLLKDLFAPFGSLKRAPVLRKGLPWKGQAWIIFDHQEDAEKAIKALQGTRVWGKSIVIKYARFKSDCVVREVGGGGEEALEAEKKIRENDRIERSKNPRVTRRQLLTRLMTSNPSAMQSISISGPDVLLPNRILFIQNLPPSLPSNILPDLFRRYPGFQDLRSIPNRPDVAFVEYENESQAGAARQILDKSEILPGHVIRVSFARR
jgi:U2 small nuclear ribonucleoprotein B''